MRFQNLVKVSVEAARMIMLCNLASCVCLNDKPGGRNSFNVLLMNYFMVVTSHDICDCCWRSSLPFSDFSISWPLVMAYLRFSIC